MSLGDGAHWLLHILKGGEMDEKPRSRSEAKRLEAQRCSDPRCDEHGDFATSHKATMERDVCTDLHQDGSVTMYSGRNRRLTLEAKAFVWSCTGPTTMMLTIPRDVLHQLIIGPESVLIELAEAVE